MGLVRTVATGALAGAVATAAMDALWYRRYRAEGGTSGFATWEFSNSAAGFDDDDTPAPAKVGKRIADAVGIDLPTSSVAATNDIVHWATGMGWGKVAGLAAAIVPRPALAIGLTTGVVAWGTSYAVLGAAGIYEPIDSYDLSTLWNDLSAHLVFGAALGAVLTTSRFIQR